MTTSITREFLGWERPLLESAEKWLTRKFVTCGQLDLGRVIVVVPGRRAGRRLLELLVLRAEQEGVRLTPPQIETIGALPERLYPLQRPLASDLVQQLTWAKVLRESKRAVLSKIIPRPPSDDDALAWWSLGTMLWKQHRELAADGHDFADVVKLGRDKRDGFETARWEAMRQVQEKYHRTLDGLGLWDAQTARLVAIEKREPHTDRDLVLVGTVDMNRATRQMLEQVAERVTALVAAPSERAEWFDEHGCLLPNKWCEAPIDVPLDRIRVCEGPAEQAEQVARELSAFGERFRADEVVIGLTDDRLGPFVERELATRGVATRWIEGTTLADSAPSRLLLAVAEALERDRFEGFASLVRHPDLDECLTGRLNLAALDASFSEHLPLGPETLQAILEQPKPARLRPRRKLVGHVSNVPSAETFAVPRPLGSGQRGPLPNGRGTDVSGFKKSLTDDRASHDLPSDDGSSETNSLPHRLLREVRDLLAPLRGKPRTLSDWSEPLRNWIESVYGNRDADESTLGGRVVVKALQQLGTALEELHAIPTSIAPSVSAADAIRCIVRRVSEGTDNTVPPEANDNAVELLGWLELPLDDTPAAIVTSFNEGFVPTSLNSDLFLPNELRHRLGLNDNLRRFARDAYAVTLLQQARREVVWLVGRRDADGNPLIPSRLLFAVAADELPERVLRLMGERSAEFRVSSSEERSVKLGDRAAGGDPEGIADSSRWSERSADHRNDAPSSRHPEGMPETLDASGIPPGCDPTDATSPVVCAALRPPATVSDPFGINACDSALHASNSELSRPDSELGTRNSELPVPRPAQVATQLGQPELLQPKHELTLSVTAFKSYLACPYRYFLRHELGLGTLSDDAVELDGLAFGNVLHDVLRLFGESDTRDSDDENRIRCCLLELLNEIAHNRFGPRRRAAVNVQLKQMESRLEVFATWQTKWRRDGWKIEHVERSIRPEPHDSPASFQIDEVSVWLHGRLDRIDQNETTGAWVIFDYKSGDRGDSPDQSHRKKEAWIDLQLPLYRHLARNLALPTELQLGYINLPKELADVGAKLADWSLNDLADADEQAKQVARAIARREFWPPKQLPAGQFREFDDICQVGVFGAE